MLDRRRTALAAASLAVLASLGLTACSGGAATPRQTTVTEITASSEEQTGALTPLQRGDVRRDALAVARAGMEAWKKNDVAGIRSNFATNFADFFVKNIRDYDKAGKVRVRKYRDIAPLDVVDMNATGTQVLATWEFYDDSYVATKAGKALTTPTKADTSLQLTLDKTSKGWQISRIIGADAVLK